MQAYALQELSLVVEHDMPKPPDGLERLLQDLSFVRTAPPQGAPALRLRVFSERSPPTLPAGAREAFRAEGFCGLESGAEFLLTDGCSLLSLRPAEGTAEARMEPGFYTKPELLQRNFWSFGLMKLLRARGIFTLHAAALVDPAGTGLLLVARPGSGKSTLAIGLIRRAWRYLSDDAVLLRGTADGVVALALRKHFYVDEDQASRRYADLNPAAAVADATGGQRRRVDIEGAYPGRHLPACEPRLLVFPQIEPQRYSALESLDAAAATHRLLAESGPQLFDRASMARHFAVLGALVRQCRVYRLHAGSDLHADPGALETLLQRAGE